MLKPFTKFLYLLVYDNNTQWCIGVSSRADVWIHDALLGRGKHLGAADCWPGLKPLRQGVRVALVPMTMMIRGRRWAFRSSRTGVRMGQTQRWPGAR